MKKKSLLLGTLSTIIVLASTILFLALPYLCDLYLLPRLTRELPFAEKEFSLSRITPWKVIGTFTLADQGQPVFSVPRFELHYRPFDLFRGKITRLLIDSASLHIIMRDGRPVIAGLTTDPTSDKQEKNRVSLLLPLAVETIIVKNSTITLHRSPQETVNSIVNGHIAVDFLQQTQNKKLLSGLSGEIFVRGDVFLRGKFQVTSVTNGHETHWQLLAPNISQFTTFFPELKKLRPTGEFSLDGQIKTEQLRRITDYKATAQLSRFRCDKNNFIFENKSVDEPIFLNLEGNLEKARYSITGALLTAPKRGELALTGQLEIVKGNFNGTGTVLFAGMQSPFAIQMNGNTNQAETRIDYLLQSDAHTLNDNLSFSPFTVEGTVNITGSSLSGKLTGQIPKIVDKSNKTTLVDLSLKMPFQFPLPQTNKHPAGEFTIKEIQYKRVNSGRLRATLIPSAEGVDFTTIFSTPFSPSLQLNCTGAAQLTSDFSLVCHIPETDVESSSLPPYIELPDEFSFSGKLQAEGEFSMNNKKTSGKLALEYNDGTVAFGENRLAEINLGVVFPKLPLIQSAPGQLCTIGSLDLGEIKLSDARIRFRIEDEQSIFLENSRLSWCGGKVDAGSFRISKSMEELETTLYCDRLRFTELLSQFGIKNTEGEGALNGKLPLRITKNKVLFDDGFLFSTPGNSGIVRFNNTKQLRQGMEDMVQTAYLDYSLKALENFSYNWTKLSFNSQEDDLLISMQLDGKPEKPLPFGYKKGHIVPSSKGPGLQHPIRLDVNFRLPVQDLFQYGKNIQSIMENL